MWSIRERSSADTSVVPMDGVVRTNGDGAAAMLRSLHPSALASASAPSVAVTAGGAVLVAYVSGDAEGAEGAAVVVARLGPGRTTFDWPAKVVARAPGAAMGPPAIFHTPASTATARGAAVTTVLFSSSVAFAGVRGNQLVGARSLDDGLSWEDMPAADLPGDLRSVEVHAPPVQIGCYSGGRGGSDSGGGGSDYPRRVGGPKSTDKGDGMGAGDPGAREVQEARRGLPWGVEGGPGFEPVAETFGGGSFHGVDAGCASYILPVHVMPRGALDRSSQHSTFARSADGGKSWRHDAEEGRWGNTRKVGWFASATVGACARKLRPSSGGGGGSSAIRAMVASAVSAAGAAVHAGRHLAGAGVDAATMAAGVDTPKSPEQCRPQDVGTHSLLDTVPFHAGALVAPVLVRLRTGAIAAFFASTAGESPSPKPSSLTPPRPKPLAVKPQTPNPEPQIPHSKPSIPNPWTLSPKLFNYEIYTLAPLIPYLVTPNYKPQTPYPRP